MCDFIKKNFIKLLLFLVITACESNQHPVPRCIPADMLSEMKTASVSAYFAPQSEDFVSDDQLLGDSIKNDQVVRWKYTGYVTDGRPIILKAEGMWTAWVDQSNANNVSSIGLGEEELDRYNDILSVERICGPYNKIEKTFVPSGQASCKVSCELISGVKDDLERGAYGPPCWFKNGYGAYLLFKRPNDPEPNQTLNHMRYPVSPVMHIGYKPLELAGNDVYSTKSKPIMDSLCQKITLEPGWKIYVKILDKCYYDNVGGYAITFIEGVKTEKQFSVFEWVRKQVRGELDKAGEKIFKHIVGNPVFKNFVFSLLTLFLLFGALAYIFGIVQSPFGDIIVRVLKVSLIILLISPSSWEFFYNHLLSLFIHGIDQIIAIINSHASSYNPKEPLAFLDDMIVNKIFSPVIWKIKIRALIIADFSSIFAVCVIIIAIFLYIALCIYGFVIYLTAFVGITFLVGLFPLLLLGILFSQFKHLFDGWLTQCISFAMQAILIFTLISLFGALIMNYYYRIFGFTTCYNEWLKVRVCLLGNLGCILDKGVFGWTPGQVYDPKIIGFPLSTDLFMDRKPFGNARYQFTGGGAYIDVPPDRKYKDFRYLDYPFLDPDTKTDGNPFGVNVSQSSPFRQLSYYINALLASQKRYVAARLIKDIEDELDVLEKKQVINAASKNKVLQIIQERRKKDKLEQKSELDKYKDEDFKFQIINNIISDIMAGAIQDPTPQEELNKQYDYNLILRIRAGYLILWTEVGSLFLAALLIWQMRAFIQSVAVSLAGGSMMSQTLAGMYEGGFIRIFSGIPVVGVVFEKIDQGIDSFKFVTGNYVTRVARMPLNALRSVPYLGKAVKFTAGATNVLTSSYNEHDRNFSNNFRKLNYARAFIGAHLGFSPLDAMKYLGGHIVGKALDYREGSLIHNAIEDRKAALDSLKAHMLGPEKYKPSPYIPNKKEEDDDKNPFAKERSHKAGSSELLDEDGNVYVNKENLKDALETREQLKTMLDNTKDDTALRNIKYDIDRLDNALRQHLDDKFDDVIQSYANSRDLIPHPQDLLPENLSMLRTPSEGETSGVRGNTALSDMMQMYNDTLDVVSPVSDTRLEISKQDSEGDIKHRVEVFTGSADVSEHGVSSSESMELKDLEKDLGTVSGETSGATGNTKLGDMIQMYNDTRVDDTLDVVSPVSSTRSEILKQDSEGAVKDRVEVSTDFTDTPKDVVSPISDTKSEILEQDSEGAVKDRVEVSTGFTDTPKDVVSPVSDTRLEISKQDSEGDIKHRVEVFTGSADVSEHGVSSSESIELKDLGKDLGTVSGETSGATGNTKLGDMIQMYNDTRVDDTLDVVSPVSSTRSEILKQDSEGAVKDRVEVSTDFTDTPKDVVSPMSDTRSEILKQDSEGAIKDKVEASTDLDISQYSTSLEKGIESKDLGMPSDETSRVKDPAELDIAQVHSDIETSASLDVSQLQSSVDDSIQTQDDVERSQESVLSQENVELKDHIGETTGYDGENLSSETASEENNTMLMQNLYDEQIVSLSPEEKSDLYSETEKHNESGLSVLADNATTEDVEQGSAEDISTNKLNLDYNVLDVGDLEKDLDSTDIKSDKTLQQFSVESEKEVDDNSIVKKGEDDKERLQQSDAEVSSTLSIEPYDIYTSERVDDGKMHDGIPYDSGLENKGDVVTQESDLDQSSAGSTDDGRDGAVSHVEETVPESSEELEEANESDDQIDNETYGVDDEELKIEETDDVPDQSDSERDYESGDGEFSNNDDISNVEGLINVVTTSEENVITEDLQQHVQPNIQSNAMSLKKDKDVVVDKNISSDELDIKDVGIVKEKKKESGESKTDNSGKAKSAKTAVNRKSLKKSLKVILNQCTNDLSEKFWLSIDKIFEDSKSGKQKRKLSKQDILLMIRQLEAVIASLKDRKIHLTDPGEIKKIEASIKQAESTIKNLLNQG
ncbi:MULTISPECIES: type IV secretion system protein [Ehrlichia]|uniref:Polymyxin resistance PmrD family protein n=1 Tax=Ehrlichia cf. muris str. EmCRT TaxID=1359167 RepID=A0A0F3NBC4_9RICK|nr:MULTISPECIES: type IV secretion system protein [Ehrlichia]KJV65388.1 polymyxin resistance PmrD family protein [Ehrlichia cf. muris str. EmCRT]OUC04662.1 conjugal transfer protein [Ehrlichia sp. Wisconsin_h]